MQVGGTCEGADFLEHALEQPTHLGGVRHPSGVREADFVNAYLGQQRGQMQHIVLGHHALQGAAKSGGHADLDRHAGGHFVAQAQDGPHLVDHGFGCFAHIGHGVRGAGRYGQGQLLGARSQRGLRAAQVGHQSHDAHAAVAQRVLHHLRGVGHLRQELGGDKGGHFDLSQASRCQRVNPAQLVGRGHGGLDRLQAIARANFADQNLRGVKACHG